MQLPINIPFDLSVNVHITITHLAISDRDISNETVNPHQTEVVDYDLVVPYPLARCLMEHIDDFVCENPEGVTLRNPRGQILLNLETGELNPEENNG